MSKHGHPSDSEQSSGDEVSAQSQKSKRQKILEAGVSTSYFVEQQVAVTAEVSGSAESSSVDWPGVQEADFLEAEENANFSQNKNKTSLLCTQSSGLSYLTRPLSSLNFDHSVDDPLFWGPYLSERQWGTVREDYSENDNCWEHVSHEDATHHAYLSGEDGLMGVSDKCQLLCASLALWNTRDTILKERLFGLTGLQGNHGEDVKELYYYLDNLPDHSYMKCLYRYPMAAFPYEWLRQENKRRTHQEPEFELLDSGVFEERGHWDVTMEYAKTDHLGLACRIEVLNTSTLAETLHVIPQFFFRHIEKNEQVHVPQMPANWEKVLRETSDGCVKINYNFGEWRLIFQQAAGQDRPTLLFTDNVSSYPVTTSTSTSNDLVSSSEEEQSGPVYTKNAFHQYIVHGKEDAVNPDRQGSKCGAQYRLSVAAGGKATVFWRIESLSHPQHLTLPLLNALFTKKRAKANEYYNQLMPKWSVEERNIGRQAIAGLLWSKQYYLFDVKNWLEDCRRCQGNQDKLRNCAWSHVHNHHILLMPDKWEFPWYAGWDLCISAVLYARYDSDFAKHQMTSFLSECFMHPNGQLPGCEFQLGDPNPPLQAWAVLRVFQLDGESDVPFLRKCFHRLLLNYTWFCSLEYRSTCTFGKGFFGMDNVSVVDRSGQQPKGWSLVQADCTAWMACYDLWMLQITLELSQTDPVYLDLIPRFLTHFLNIATAMNKPVSEQGLWHEEDGFFYDVFQTPCGPAPIRLHSMAGLVPLLGTGKVKVARFSHAEVYFERHFDTYQKFMCRLNDHEVYLSVLCISRTQSILDRVFSEDEFLSPYGIRSMSKVYDEKPYSQMVGDVECTVKYVPGESDSGAFGGNSNWRGPVWVFMNQLLLESMDQLREFENIHCGNDRTSSSRMNSDCLHRQALTFTCPTRGRLKLQDLMSDLEQRLLSVFLPDKGGRRPLHGSVTRYADDPRWRNLVLFYEYFHAETGRGCGASHQTGWTAAIVEIIYRIHEKKSSCSFSSIEQTYFT